LLTWASTVDDLLGIGDCDCRNHRDEGSCRFQRQAGIGGFEQLDAHFVRLPDHDGRDAREVLALDIAR
jgi:hypothetical protein